MTFDHNFRISFKYGKTLIFEKEFIKEDTKLLTLEEKKSIVNAEQEFKEGATKKVVFGG